ncbi:MAG: hypothetical protein ABFS56_29510 [Pseudomonadota bacterium]
MQYSSNKNFERGDKIQPFYNRFSYPLAESNSNVNGAKLFKILDREMQSKGFKGKTFPLMIVGCGAWASNIGCCQGFSRGQVLRI